MPAGGRRGAVAAALCVALGSTALLTWAFSVFAEDKKKKPLTALPSAPHGSPSRRSLNGSDRISGDGQAEDKPTATENEAKLRPKKKDKDGAVIIENKSVRQPGDATLPYHYPTYNKVVGETKIEDVDTKTQPVNEDIVLPSTSSSFLQNVPKFDEKYNSSLSRTSIADTVAAENISAIPEGIPHPDLERSVSQLDNKVTTYEEKEPMHDVLTVDEVEHYNSPVHIPASVSCKSLASSVRFAPSPQPKSGKRSSHGQSKPEGRSKVKSASLACY